MIDMDAGEPPILVVGDGLERGARERALREAGLAAEVASSGAEALERLEKGTRQVLLVGERLADMDGTQLIRALVERNLSHTVVLLLEGGEPPDAGRVRGAYDFLLEPVDDLRLVTTLRNARERTVLHAAVEDLSPDMGPAGYFGFIGRSVSMRSVYRMVESVAGSRATVFITGERGTGKQVCAEAIHKAGPRARSPFVALDCTAYPPDWIEEEIFGAEGAIARASGGTLFLREIRALDVDLQEKFLRFLQTGTLPDIDGEGTRAVDVRVICATDHDPMKDVAEGRFREDLFYRLHVLPIHLPPLREREGDAVEIAARALRETAAAAGKRFRNLTPAARTVLAAYDWPGNVSELQGVIRDAVAAHDGEVLEVSMLPGVITGEGVVAPRQVEAPDVSADEPHDAEETGPGPADGVPDESEGADSVRIAVGETLAEMERRYIEATIESCDGSLPRAARMLGVSPSTLYRKRESWAQDA